MLEPEQHAEDIGESEAEPLIRPRRTVLGGIDMGIDITPMIDVTFLLLIFFLVTSKAAHSTGVALPQARHGNAIARKESVVLTLAGSGDEVRIFLGEGTSEETKLAAVDAAEQAAAIVQYVDRGMRGPPRKQYVLIQAERSVKHRHVDRLIHILGQVPDVQSVYVAVLEE